MVQRLEPERRGIPFMEVKPGTRLKMSNGDTVEVIENPRDGYWLIVKFLLSPMNPSLVGTQDMVFYQDIDAVADKA